LRPASYSADEPLGGVIAVEVEWRCGAGGHGSNRARGGRTPVN